MCRLFVAYRGYLTTSGLEQRKSLRMSQVFQDAIFASATWRSIVASSWSNARRNGGGSSPVFSMTMDNPGAQDARVSTREEQRHAQSEVRDDIAMCPFLTRDQAVEAQPPQLIRHSPRRHGAGIFTQQRSPMLPQVALIETPGQETKHQQRSQKRQHTRISESQCRGPLSVHLDRFGHLTKRAFAHRAVVADSLDVQKTSVGLEADCPQCGQILQPLADAEVARVIDRRLGAEGSPLLVVLLASSQNVNYELDSF